MEGCETCNLLKDPFCMIFFHLTARDLPDISVKNGEAWWQTYGNTDQSKKVCGNLFILPLGALKDIGGLKK